MNTATLSDADLHKYAGEHIKYEVDMLVGATVATPSNDWFLHCSRVEAFAIHLRNLITFFYPTPNQKPTDVYAQDYVLNRANWNSTGRPLIPPELEDARNRAHREVGHLTTLRIAGTPAHKAWDMPGLIQKLKPTIMAFRVAADPNKLHPDTFVSVP